MCSKLLLMVLNKFGYCGRFVRWIYTDGRAFMHSSYNNKALLNGKFNNDGNKPPLYVVASVVYVTFKCCNVSVGGEVRA